jgi:hypothetical protein
VRDGSIAGLFLQLKVRLFMSVCKLLISQHTRLVGPRRALAVKLRNRRRHHLVNTLLFDKKHKVIIDWTPKSGCTIAAKMFFKSMGLFDEAIAYAPWIHKYRQEVFYKSHVVLPSDLLNQDNFLFKVVRNPYMRVVSSYIHICLNGHKNPKKQAKRKKDFVDYASITFAQFIDELARIDIRYDCDPHCRVQTKNYEREGLRQPVICKLETLAHDLEKVNTSCKTNFSIDSITSKHHAKKEEGNAEFCGEKTWQSFSRAYPDYKYFYNQAIFDKVTRLYREDIERYNYESPWPGFLG